MPTARSPFAAAPLIALALPALVVADSWPPERAREILEATLTVRLAPDLAHLTAGERAAVGELLAAGELLQRIYEQQKHRQADESRSALAAAGAREDLRTLFRIFQGPVATTLDNRREPFLAVDAETPGKAVWPWGITVEEVEAFLAAHPARRAELLDVRTAVRRATAAEVKRDLDALARHPALDALHPGLGERLRALAAAPDPKHLYAVPYALAWADELAAASLHLFAAADAVAADDAELAGYLRNRARDLLTNDYESGDAPWVTGRFGRLNAQIGAYETYDDALFGVKAFHGLSLLVRDEGASAELARGLSGLQAIEDSLPWRSDRKVRSEVSAGVYDVVADFGQARGTNTATILPNDALFSRRYGRTILMRANVLRHDGLAGLAERRWRAAVAAAHADAELGEGGFRRTLWHEVGHYLGPDRTADGRALDEALQSWADALEEMKSDLVSLAVHERFRGEGTIDEATLAAVRASGVLRTLLSQRPRRDQPYQTMQLAQFNFFLDRGLLAFDRDGRLTIDHGRYAATVRELLAEVIALQRGGDAGAAAEFFTRWTGWDERHQALGDRLQDAEGPRFRLVRYAALGE
ncbi:MAG: hypothetical protein AMXMBFR36_32910 [Acidobacteriota bacterium]